MNKILSQSLLVGLTVLMGASVYLTQGQPSQALVVPAAAFLLIIASLVIERLVPFERSWNSPDKDVGGDIAAFVVNDILVDGLAKTVLPIVVLALLGSSFAPSFGLPFWQEVLAAGLLIELAAYVSHRLHHKYKGLWALHAMHHSPRRMYTLNNFRFHPLNYLINNLVMFAPPLALGFSAGSVLAYAAVSLPVLILQHSNVAFRFGWLNYIFNSNAVHRWHHSARLCEGNRNFGRATLIWDHAFGTFYLPGTRRGPEELGIEPGSLPSYPSARQFWGQLKYPFSAHCCR